MLKISNLHVSYGGIKALHGIDILVNEKEIVALIGNNGAGKTTTLNTVCGVLKPDVGKIEYLGQDITGMPSDKIARMGIAMVPEGRGMFSGLSVSENLEMGAYTRKDKRAIKQDMEKCYELFPILFERKNQKSGTLSGGEQQMLAISRALMAEPKIILLDEPSLGLAPLVVESIFEKILDINASGLPILLIEQNVNMALEIADKGYVIETGRITLEDDAENLLNNLLVQSAYLGGAV